MSNASSIPVQAALSGCHSPSPTSPSPVSPMDYSPTNSPSPYTVSLTHSSVPNASFGVAPLSPLPGFEHYSYPSSDSTSTAPTPSPSPPPPKPAKITRRNRGPDHIRRPRNPFIIFRTEYYRTKKSSLTFEKDHRHISRIIGFCWRNLSPAEKKPWYDKADAEKKEHARLYPDYQYIPLTRNEPVRRRKVKRNGKSDIERCAEVAKLLGQGKEGKDIVEAIKGLDLDSGSADDSPCIEDTKKPVATPPATRRTTRSTSPTKSKGPVFRSPLYPTHSLPPTKPIAHADLLMDTMPSLGSPTSSDSSGSDLSAFDIPLVDSCPLPYPFEDSYALAFGMPMDDFASLSPPSLPTMEMPHEYIPSHTDGSYFSETGTIMPASTDATNFLPMPMSNTVHPFPGAFPPNLYSGSTCFTGFSAAPVGPDGTTLAWSNDFLAPMAAMDAPYYPSPLTVPHDLTDEPVMGPYASFYHDTSTISSN